MDDLTALTLVLVIAFVIGQHIALRRATEAADKLATTLHGIAEGTLEVMIDNEGDILIRKKRGK